MTPDPQAPTLEEAIARVERMIRTRAPIEWTEGPRDLPRRRTQGGEEAAALRVVLEAARDGQRKEREIENFEARLAHVWELAREAREARDAAESRSFTPDWVSLKQMAHWFDVHQRGGPGVRLNTSRGFIRPTAAFLLEKIADAMTPIPPPLARLVDATADAIAEPVTPSAEKSDE